MGLFDRKKLYTAFFNELKKQTQPYAYFLMEEENEARGVQYKSSPLVCMIGSFFTEYIVENYEWMDEEYLVFIYKNGEPAKGAVAQLFSKTDKLKPDLIYCDEDFITVPERRRHTPWMKPDWSPDTLLSLNYIGSLFAVKKSEAEQIRLLTGEECAGDDVRMYDFLLKYTEKINKITHVSKILFHRFGKEEQITQMITDEYLSEKYKAVRENAFLRRGFQKERRDRVSIIIPSKDHARILLQCLESIKNKSKFNNLDTEASAEKTLEIIIVDNGSCEEEKNKITDYIKKNPAMQIFYLYEPAPFNYSAMCNQGAREANGEYLLFMNDDVEVKDSDFIEKLLYYAAAPHTGAAGAKLYYPGSDLIQHTGVTNLDCGPSHKLAMHTDAAVYYFGRNRFNMDVLALTGACMMMSKEKYFKVGGFSDKMRVSYNDIDLCVSLYEQGFYNVIVNDCVLYHHESLSRGADQADQAKYERLAKERELFYTKHPWLRNRCDPFYNRNLIQDTLDYRVNVQADYEKRDFRNPAAVMKRHLFIRTERKLKFNIERTGREQAFDKKAEDAYGFEGWALLQKGDNALYERYLCLIPKMQVSKRAAFINIKTKNSLQASVSPKYRTDVKDVFGNAENAELAGFCCRIPVSLIEEEQIYKVGMLFVSKISNRKYMTLGDYYATGRGYFTEEV
ncbi:MAG TPA: glycosyltransferase [Lachnospiraceae bacterium]|nr:glycosyltransferase [Lachnospiraceae bacterium]